MFTYLNNIRTFPRVYTRPPRVHNILEIFTSIDPDPPRGAKHCFGGDLRNAKNRYPELWERLIELRDEGASDPSKCRITIYKTLADWNYVASVQADNVGGFVIVEDPDDISNCMIRLPKIVNVPLLGTGFTATTGQDYRPSGYYKKGALPASFGNGSFYNLIPGDGNGPAAAWRPTGCVETSNVPNGRNDDGTGAHSYFYKHTISMTSEDIAKSSDNTIRPYGLCMYFYIQVE